MVHAELPEAVEVELPHEGPEVVVLEEGGEQVAERFQVLHHESVPCFGPADDRRVRLFEKNFQGKGK